MAKEKVVLAYSGGLDTSVILKWLLEQGYEVFAYMADIGQDEDFQAAEQKALKIGASKVFIEDMKKEFVTDYIFPVFKSNTVYEGRYLLGTAIARPIIAKKQIEIAKEVGAQYVSHGATGKGNDQVRFELSYYALNPAIKVIAPWKNPDFLNAFQGRSDLLAYAEKHGIQTKQTAAKPYSEDDNLLHISHEAGILEDPGAVCDESIYSRTVSPEKAPDTPTRITIEFKDGIPVKVKNLEDGTEKTDALDLFLYLNQLGAENGIGRLDMVENRFVGIKSRGVYETPGGAILHEAHKDIEGIAMDREVMRLRDMLAAKLGELVYNGFWFSPEMEFLMAAIDKSQELIDGEVTLKLFKGVAYPISRTSPSSLYNQDLSSMDITGGYNQEDAEGFIRVNAIRLMAHRDITRRN
ncbi:argininosuccinate synthase [Desulfobacter hydrogenophilus]|uniref:Argininosuccinate synthase n=1 Tax=Desulfobacter hydrogenophilus TaxID=2291 RepID=A0A328FEW5_9BACT|nr:argininosuccinate synthase [Desulfobacter hydrogenophilus]NDY71730.1 argininosuccinate synthase [Desulfobacter hydrogenophilus]QBH13238.1 argininosuccinate synthase [Desulfobacter hydrogenophilus]RAM02340.1 argininosuccinate synthase [Desulfobacter hydrogenophilus]